MINIAEILKDCPKGAKLYSPMCGEVELENIIWGTGAYIYIKPINVGICYKGMDCFNCYGQLVSSGECLLFPSKEQRDWTNFKVQKEKFDPHTLRAFSRIIARYAIDGKWYPEFVSFLYELKGQLYSHLVGGGTANAFIPYNDDTKHLLGTTDDCPEYYKWWKEK